MCIRDSLCPFHAEKTPSFVVHPDRQFFRCYGCGKAGDVFAFVAEHEHVDFPEAVRIVAAMVGITVPEPSRERGGPSKELKTRLYELHRWAARFYAHQLAEADAGRVARDYLAGRHFDNETLEAWSIGYAPDAWEALGRAATRAKFTGRELLASGLVIARDGGEGYYDRFRHRVMFPIRDRQGRVIGFGARALGDSEVKYLNSPETPLFSKGRCLYGLDKARRAIADDGRVLIVEGYTDVLMCHQMGIETAVATLGTALTRDHVRRLQHYADRVTLVFDADAAGAAAAERALEIFLAQQIHVRVATVPEGKDPCDYCLSSGADALRKVISDAPDALQYVWSRAQEAWRGAGGSLADRRRVMDDFLRLVVSSTTWGGIDEIRRGQLAQHIGHMLNISAADLQQQMRRRVGEGADLGDRPHAVAGVLGGDVDRQYDRVDEQVSHGQAVLHGLGDDGGAHGDASVHVARHAGLVDRKGDELRAGLDGEGDIAVQFGLARLGGVYYRGVPGGFEGGLHDVELGGVDAKCGVGDFLDGLDQPEHVVDCLAPGGADVDVQGVGAGL